MTAQDAAAQLRKHLGSALLSEGDFRDEKSFSITLESVHGIAQFCRDSLGFDYLIDITSVDHFGDDPRFELVYELYSMADGVHIRLKAMIPGDDAPIAPTVSDLWPTADWHEREIYDMMGVHFEGHPDLRRILMWDGYPYFPLRKDFPLEGKPSDVPETAFTEAAPLAGGPFVTVPTDGITEVREPRARRPGDEPPRGKFLADT